MTFTVFLVDDAVRDLEGIDDYLRRHDSPQGADHVLDKITDAILSLEELPERGPHPPELAALGIQEYRELFFKPYRVIYRVQSKKVYVYLIADGRRDMRELLSRRMLGG